MPDTTLYYRTADGALATQTVSGETAEAPALPEGATELTEAEYAAEFAAIEEARQEHAADLVAADEANQSADYEALRAAGIPEATTRRLTGYTGPDTAD
ncbi:hypothetical protein [Streptomyces salinarius]|uniref:hypothetical protein n=1 Tax=Streptomyces salinarius TaxID=2762598 RepID=UPI002852762D|nr:hypothetical protein [Streptomyces salinarius]